MVFELKYGDPERLPLSIELVYFVVFMVVETFVWEVLIIRRHIVRWALVDSPSDLIVNEMISSEGGCMEQIDINMDVINECASDKGVIKIVNGHRPII